MNNIKLFFAGDFCSKPSTSKIAVSEELKELIQSCDFKVVNFEVPLKPDKDLPPQKRERFFQNDDAPEFLRGLGFNLFSIANNHAFDWGDEGFKKTKAVLGDQAFGAGIYNEAYHIKTVEVNGVKIGFMALSFAAYTGVFDDVMNHDGLGCAYINDLRVNHDIMDAKKHLDYLFILPHDGIEYIDIPMPETIARYRDFIDYGADGVIGTHPHCPQGWEEYKGKPIFYSLGNFFFNSKDNVEYRTDKPHWYEGICVLLSLGNSGISWRVINTKNFDNVKIIIERDYERDKHNEKLRRFLRNKEVYIEYLKDACLKLGGRELAMIDMTFHPQTLLLSTKVLIRNWINRIRKIDFTDNEPIDRLLSHEGNRSLLIHAIRFLRINKPRT